MAQRRLRPGDIVFCSAPGWEEGEAMVLGHRADDERVLVLKADGKVFEWLAEEARFTGRGKPPEGKAARDAYLRKTPRALV